MSNLNHYATIAEAAAAELYLQQKLASHLSTAKAVENRIREEINQARQAVNIAAAGIDLNHVQIAESVLDIRGRYSAAGGSAGNVLNDAIAEIATGEKQAHRGLWSECYGVKNYAQWTGQRSDHAYGFGPRHGSITFAIGYRKEVLKRQPQELTEEERIACVYYLENLAKIQAAKERAA